MKIPACPRRKVVAIYQSTVKITRRVHRSVFLKIIVIRRGPRQTRLLVYYVFPVRRDTFVNAGDRSVQANSARIVPRLYSASRAPLSAGTGANEIESCAKFNNVRSGNSSTNTAVRNFRVNHALLSTRFRQSIVSRVNELCEFVHFGFCSKNSGN